MPDDATPITIPALERFLKDARPWGLVDRHPQGYWGGKAFDQQRTDPDPKGLLELVGLGRGERTLVVAGHRATWARALARAGAKVTYSDVSRELTDHVRKNVEHRNLVDYLCTSYVTHPEYPGQYDWTFTFEAVGPKPFILLVSMLNTQGGKYVIWDKGEHAQRKLTDLSATISLCKRVYKVAGSITAQEIVCTDRKGKKKTRHHQVVTIETNDEARQRIHFDLGLFRFFFKRRKASSEHLCALYGCSRPELRRALNRLSKWCDLFKPKYTRTVPIKCLGSGTRS